MTCPHTDCNDRRVMSSSGWKGWNWAMGLILASDLYGERRPQ